MNVNFALNRFNSVVLHYAFFESLSNLYQKNIISNFISAIHAIIIVIMSFFFMITENSQIYNFETVWSTGYFIFDAFYMIKYKELNIIRLSLLYHHIITIYIIHLDTNFYYGHQILFWGELSNIPSYFVYHHLHKRKYMRQELLFWLKMQKYLYSTIRIPIIGCIAIKAWTDAPNKFPIIIASPIYLMGLIWTYKILTNKNNIPT